VNDAIGIKRLLHIIIIHITNIKMYNVYINQRNKCPLRGEQLVVEAASVTLDRREVPHR
jgi:hypothetical protein